jgi:hypothetical protein
MVNGPAYKRFHQGIIHVHDIVLVDHRDFGKPDEVGRDAGKIGMVVKFYDEPGWEDLATVRIKGQDYQLHVPSQIIKKIGEALHPGT